MSFRAQLWATFVLVGAAGLFAFSESQPLWGEIALAGLGLAYLAAFPETTLVVMLLTLSCDRILTVKAGDSATLRLAHVCAAVLFTRLAVTRLAQRRPVRFARPAVAPLALYFAVALANLAVSAGLGAVRSAGYVAWALFDAVALFTVVLEASATEKGFRRVVRWWIAGAALNAGFGLVQLALGVAHAKVPLVDQKLGEFPRINGFNYEPAYFALYLESVVAVLVGRWVALGEGRAPAIAAVLAAAAALSMSRSGWLGMGLIGFVLAVSLAVRARGLTLVRAGAAVGALACAGLLVLPERFVNKAPEMAAMALNAHEASSTAPRLSMMGQAEDIFLRHPVLGVGVGGYSGFVIENPELIIPGMEGQKDRFVTTNLWLEILAETGTVGLGLVLWFLGVTVAALWRSAKRAEPERRAWAAGFLLSVLLVFGVLYHFNQTLWRLDVWVLLALAWSAVGLAKPRAEPA